MPKSLYPTGESRSHREEEPKKVKWYNESDWSGEGAGRQGTSVRVMREGD